MNSMGRTQRTAMRWAVLHGAVAFLVAGGGALAHAAPPLTDAETERWVERLAGAWAAGEMEAGSMAAGGLPCALFFELQSDGSLRAHTAASRDTWIELHFVRSATDGWRCHAGLSIANQGPRWRTLAVHHADAKGIVWADVQDPQVLQCRFAVDATHLEIGVAVRGREHARVRLPRVADPRAVANVRATLRAAKERPEPSTVEDRDDPSQDPRDARR